MKVTTYKNEILFPAHGEQDEKQLYAKVAVVLRRFDGIDVGETITGPWCDYRTCSLNGSEFKLVHDLDDGTYILCDEKDVLLALRDKLKEA